MKHRILITGSCGLVGSALSPALTARGVDVVHLDTRASGAAHGDVRDRERLRRAMVDVDGVIHLAAVSRVAWGERDPALCWSTNVDGSRNVLEIAASPGARPWVVFASSREVYGQPDRLPVTEDCVLRPINVYGRSKAEGERLVNAAQRAGVRACTIRLSNVFGSVMDHPDRVVPAFARAAAFGEELRVDGADHTFDFTHVDDVARGIVALADLLETGNTGLSPIHFVSGTPTTLGQLADMAIRIARELGDGAPPVAAARTRASVRIAPPRDFDVTKFFGDPARAEAVLGWRARIDLEEGVTRLVREFRGAPRAVQEEESAS